MMQVNTMIWRVSASVVVTRDRSQFRHWNFLKIGVFIHEEYIYRQSKVRLARFSSTSLFLLFFV